MIKLPKEVTKIIKTLENERFEAYATGECVRDTLAGLKPFGWDVSTSAKPEDLKRLFPDSEVINQRLGVFRIEKIQEMTDEQGEVCGEEGLIIDIASYRKNEDGKVGSRMVLADNISEDLGCRVFTANAIADNTYSNVDPFGGVKDIEKKLVRTIGSAEEIFTTDPIRMMQAIEVVGDLGFDLQKDVFAAIAKNFRLLEKIPVEKVRDSFIKIMASANAGKGLSLIIESGIIRVILGDETFNKLSRRERSDLKILSQNIDRSKQVEERRLGLLYSIINKKRSLASIDRMKYEPETHQLLVDAATDMAKLYFTSQPPQLKKFIYGRGWDRYNYLANLEKAQRIVFDYHSDTKIKSKMYMVDEINRTGDVVFEKDLVIDANDLIEAGICTADNVGKMLSMLTEALHIKPNLNTRKDLFKLAKKYKRNKLAALTRGVKWVR